MLYIVIKIDFVSGIIQQYSPCLRRIIVKYMDKTTWECALHVGYHEVLANHILKNNSMQMNFPFK